jgi:hypothetical protein
MNMWFQSHAQCPEPVLSKQRLRHEAKEQMLLLQQLVQLARPHVLKRRRRRTMYVFSQPTPTRLYRSARIASKLIQIVSAKCLSCVNSTE